MSFLPRTNILPSRPETGAAVTAKGSVTDQRASPPGLIRLRVFPPLTLRRKSPSRTVRYGSGRPGTPRCQSTVPPSVNAEIMRPSVRTAKPYDVLCGGHTASPLMTAVQLGFCTDRSKSSPDTENSKSSMRMYIKVYFFVLFLLIFSLYT